jgi:hypothetical protein
MTIYALLQKYVNGARHHHGRAPKQNRALQAFIGAYLVRERVLGIDTATKAAIATGVTRGAVEAALIILQSEGTDLLASHVLSGRETLTRGAKTVRGRVKLIDAFKTASADDRAALGHVFGAAELFDTVISPAL